MLEKCEDRSLLATLIGVYLDTSHVAEGGSAIFRLHASQPAMVPITIHGHTQPGTATENLDYIGSTFQVQLPVGATDASVPVSTLSDSLTEPTETFALHLDQVYGGDSIVDLWNNTRTCFIDDIIPPGGGSGGSGGTGSGGTGGTGSGGTTGGGTTGGGTGGTTGGGTTGGGTTGGGTGGGGTTQPPPTGSSPPTFPAGNSPTCDENTTAVAIISAVDWQGNLIHSYALAGGADVAKFQINPTSGALSFLSPPNFEAPTDLNQDNLYLVQVRATDSLNQSATQNITVHVLNVNESPTISPLFMFVDENTPTGTVLGTMIASDPDANTTLTYSIASGNANGGFALNAATGELSVLDGSKLDFEIVDEYLLTIAVSDGALSNDATVYIAIKDLDEVPEFLSASFSLDENPAQGAVIGTVSGIDPEGVVLAYSIISSTPAGAAVINAATGELTVASPAIFDHETNPLITLTVRASDGSLHTDATVTITVDDLNEAPTVSGGPFTVPENSANGTVVGTVVAQDPDSGTTLIYAIAGGNTKNLFDIDPANGELTISNSGDLDHEKIKTVTLQIAVSDGLLSATSSVLVTITNVNERPQFPFQTGTLDLGRHELQGENVADLAAIDPDIGDVLTYSIDSQGNEEGLFRITTDGQLEITKAALDATQPSYALTVRVVDTGYLTDSLSLNVTVLDSVGISGDTQAVEGTADKIELTFTRYAKDPSAGLEVTYQYGWLATRAAPPTLSGPGDLVMPHALTNSIGGVAILSFPANVTTKTLVFEAVGNDGVEGIEQFRIMILRGASYIPLDEVEDVVDDIELNSAKGAVTCEVLDGVTLFAAYNPIASLHDGAQLDINRNDIAQGEFGDCYFLNAVIALIGENPEFLRSQITENADGSYTVKLYSSITGWGNYPVAADLVRGVNGAKLSGDYVPSSGKVEIWPQVLERAYADFRSGYENANGGNPSNAWTTLTGKHAESVETEGMTGAEIAQRINDALANGKSVVLLTRDTFGGKKSGTAGLTLQSGDEIHGDHGYNVVPPAAGATGFTFWNPWGGDAQNRSDLNITIDESELPTVTDGLSIFDP